jgi:hypothetical protein
VSLRPRETAQLEGEGVKKKEEEEEQEEHDNNHVRACEIPRPMVQLRDLCVASSSHSPSSLEARAGAFPSYQLIAAMDARWTASLAASNLHGIQR